MVRVGLILGAMLVVMVPFLLASPTRSVQVQTGSGELVWCGEVASGEIVQVHFTHSMFGGYVRERWLVTPNDTFRRDRFVTENAAAAEYYATDGTSYRADDGYVVPGDALVQSELVIRVDQRGNHYLTVDDETVHLAGLLPQSTQVRIVILPERCGDAT